MAYTNTTNAQLMTILAAKITAGVEKALATRGTKHYEPWNKSWSNPNRPFNGKSKKCYQGLINNMLLSFAMAENGWKSPEFRTEKQWLELGFTHVSGTWIGTGTEIQWFKKIKIKDKDTGKPKLIPMAKVYVVYNADQVLDRAGNPYGINWQILNDQHNPCRINERNENAEAFVANCGANIQHGGDVACYIPSRDEIHMPNFENFTDGAAYYATTLHELAHWSGSKSRLNRLDAGSYAFEELIAETTATQLSNILGIEAEPRDDHFKYLAGWLSKIQDDPDALIKAIQQANKATKYLQELQEPAQEKLAA